MSKYSFEEFIRLLELALKAYEMKDMASHKVAIDACRFLLYPEWCVDTRTNNL